MRVSLNGFVVASDDQWVYDWFKIGAFSPAVVRRSIAENPEGEDLELEINSPGGSVFAGFEMYSLLREAKCRTVAIVQSLAGSAASTVMAGCSDVRMSPVAQVMIHLPSSSVSGNQIDMKHEARVLEQITQSILNGYEAKSAGKATRARLENLMRSESWLTAQEAVELGLADSIIGQETEDVTIPEAVINAAGAGIRSAVNVSASVYDAGSLKDRYERLVREGAPPADGHPVPEDPNGDIEKESQVNWRARARLEIEQNRRF